jgi:predicted SAM-dependent methyltransferase
MGKGAPLRWWENRHLGRFLRGRGFEIGALWKRFPVPAAVERVWYADRLDVEGLAEHFTGHEKGVLPIDLVADAMRLPVAPRSLDFLIACNLLEHLPFPLAALRHWHEALASGGALLLRVPDKRYTFDHRRTRTPLAHLVEEYEHPERFDRRAHYADFVEHVHGRPPADPRFEKAVQKLMGKDYSIHFHTWIDDDFREIIAYTRNAWGLDWEPAVFYGGAFYRKEPAMVLRRPG